MRLGTWIYSAVSAVLVVATIFMLFQFIGATPTEQTGGGAPAASTGAGGKVDDDSKGGATNNVTGETK